MGIVYEVYDRERGELLAAKTLRHFDPLSLYLFKQEFRALADVRHPNLVRFYEFLQRDDGEVFFTMERVYGVDFLEHVREAGPDPVRLRRALRQLVEALIAVHSAGKLHRDIKPSNVLVTREGRVVLLDFGVATQLVKRSGAAPVPSGEFVGSAAYMAPEQGESTPLAASDWYSVGVLIFESLVGRPPFSGALLDVLAKKCNVDPEPPSRSVAGVPADLDALCLSLLSRDPERRPDGAEILRQLGKAPSTLPPALAAIDEVAFVGRIAQLDILTNAFEASKAGTLVAVRVAGDPGMGKTSLVQRFLAEAERTAQAVVLEGRAYEREAVPYKAVDGAIDALSDLLVTLEQDDTSIGLPEDVWALAHLFPVLRRIPSVAEDVSRPIVDPIAVRASAFAALRALLAGLAARSPVVIFLDDVHWGDVDSAGLLLDLMRPPNAPGLLLVMTQRSDEARDSRFCRGLSDRWPPGVPVHDITVGPLERDEAESLALARLDASDPTSTTIARAVARDSGGSPFLIEELARSNRAIRSATGTGLGVLSLEEMVAERLEKLPPDARAVLEAIAVAGRPMPTSVIAAASGGADLENTVGLLVARRFVRTVLRDRSEGVEMVHGRIGETVRGMLPPDALRARHLVLARVLAATPGTDPEEVALHARSAGDEALELKFCELGAEQAFSALAFDQAARLYRRTIELLPGAAPDLSRRRERLAEALKYAGRFEDAAAAYLAAAEEETPERRIDLRREAAHQLLMGGHIAKAGGVLHEVLDAVGMRAPRSTPTALVSLIAYRAWLRILGPRLSVLPDDDVAPERRLRMDALYTVVGGFSMVDPVVGACMQARHLIEALRGADGFRMLRAVVLEAAHLRSAGAPETPRERALLDVIRSLRQRVGTQEAERFASHIEGLTCFQRGRWQDARSRLQREIDELPYGHPGMGIVRLYSLFTDYYLGDVGRTIARSRQLLGQADDRGDLFMSVNLRTTMVAAGSMAEDDPGSARTMVRTALAQWPQTRFSVQHWHAMLCEAQLDLYTGQGAAGYERFTGAWRRLKRSFLLNGAAVRLPARYMRAVLAIASIAGDASVAARRIAEARSHAAMLEKESDPWVSVLVALALAAANNAAGDRDGAIAKLRLAMERAEATSTRVYLPSIRHRLGLLLGGDEGQRMVQEACAELATQGIRNPARWFAAQLPGSWGD